MNIKDNINLQFEFQKLEQTIEYAKVRCLSTSELIKKLSQYEVGDFIENYLRRLSEINLSSIDYESLLNSIDILINKSKNLLAKDKTKFENLIRRIIVYIPSQFTHKYFDVFINSTRKSGRQIAYKSICNDLITKKQKNSLLKLYLSKKEKESLKVIIFSSFKFDLQNIISILEKIDDKYWKARFIENLIINNQKEIFEIFEKYPFEFIYALGRISKKIHLDIIEKLFEENKSDLEFLSIYAYTLGKLGAKNDLDNLSRYISKTIL